MASSFVVGIGNGLLDTGASTLCLQLWGKDSGPYMQALHFSFAVGGSIAPILVQAFIAESSTTSLNNTISSRHGRSVTYPLNMSELEGMTTMASIIKAINEPSVLETSIYSNSSSLTLNANDPTSITDLGNTSTTTSNPVVSQNQTTLAIEKPKKPKPSVINGQVLGPSSQFDGVPLKIETPPPPEIVMATTTASSVLSGQILGPSSQLDAVPSKTETPPPQEIVMATTNASSNETRTTIPSNTTVVSSDNDTMKAQNSSVMETTTIILQQPKEAENSNSLSNTTTGSLQNELEFTENRTPLLLTTNASTEASTVTPIPMSTEVTTAIAAKSDAADDSQFKELVFGNETTGKIRQCQLKYG